MIDFVDAKPCEFARLPKGKGVEARSENNHLPNAPGVGLAEPILDRGILDHAFSEESSHETGETKEAEPSPEDDSVTDFVRPGRPSYSRVEAQLIRSGYRVERIPIAYDSFGKVITYNNVLMETRRGRRIVDMPVYDIPHLDAMAASTYEALGFEVRPIQVSEVYPYDGSLRCMTNVLVRLPSG